MYSKKVKYVELIFENCEVAKLEPEMFKYFSLYGIKDIVDINCYQYTDGEYDTHKTCEEFHIEILPNGLEQILYIEGITLKERLERHSDITSVCVAYDDNTQIDYYVPWPEYEDFTNTYQQLKEGFEEGALEIIIKEDKIGVE